MTEEEAELVGSDNQSRLQEKYLKSLDQLEEGQIIEGRVVQVDSSHVYVDIGYKSEGRLSLSEFKTPPEVGSVIDVVPVGKKGEEDEVVVSKRKADQKILWKSLKEALDEHKPIEGRITKSIKGGVEVDLGSGVMAFVPMSQVDVRRVQDPEAYVGLKSFFFIERLFNERKVNIVLTRREWLAQDIEKRRETFFQETSVGDTVTGRVKNFTSFGAFVEIEDGIDALLHTNDMGWGHVTSAKDYVQKGDEITVKVIRLDPETKRINLSLKHFKGNPWESFEDHYQVNDVVEGTVTKVVAFGIFIALEEGIEGLAHVSQLSFRRVDHPSELFSVGDKVSCMILGYDIHQGRVSLGVKQVLPDPWETVDEKYPVGTRLKVVVKTITDSGCFAELETGVDGYLHVSDFSWGKGMHDIASLVQVGDEIDAVVINLDLPNRRIRLGVKQISENPWDTLQGTYQKGHVIKGQVKSKTDFGVFVTVDGDIAGLIHKNNLVEERGEDPEAALDRINVGDPVEAIVMGINKERERLSLSVLEIKEQQTRKDMSKYMDEGNAEDPMTYTLGSMLQPRDDETHNSEEHGEDKEQQGEEDDRRDHA